MSSDTRTAGAVALAKAARAAGAKARAEARARARAEAKAEAELAAEKAQRPVRGITVSIEWRKSRMWGYCPTATAEVEYADGGFGRVGPVRCGGCGYDKGSTVLAGVFNRCLLGRLWSLPEEAVRGGHGSGDRGPAPYGVSVYGGRRAFSGGIGVSCYYDIVRYLGGTFEKVASGKAFDVYRATFPAEGGAV